MTGIKIFTKILFMLLLLFGISTTAIQAHGGGFSQITNAEAGPYRVSVWTQPDPIQVGEVHFTVAVSQPPPANAPQNEAGPPVLGAAVKIQLKPLDSGGETLLLTASHEEAVNKLFYETDTKLLLDGRWQALVSIDGPDGPGRVSFEIKVLPLANSTWMWAGGLGLAVLVAVWGVRFYKNGGRVVAIVAVVAITTLAAVISINWIYRWQTPIPLARAEALPINWYKLKNRLLPGEDEMVVEVTASQWAWQFDYPQSGISSTELNLPLGQTVQLKMKSTDVIHSFSVPEFRIERDIVPGVTTKSKITPIKPGTYKVSCTALCGINYDDMQANVNVMNPADFEAWLTQQQSTNSND